MGSKLFMHKCSVLLIIFQLICLFSFAQNATIKGTVIDTVEKNNLSRSVIALLRYEDSVLVQFTRSDANGNFVLRQIPAGRFLIMVTHPSFADYVDEITLAADEVKNIGNMMMTPKAKLLEEVIVRQNIAIRIKGDTIEYKADSFKVHEGANVQELLRQMPGFQVDRNGQITAHGQQVERVLVDGEEFFTDDPAVVTENLRADAIDKVQAYDKKSDQAEFTGIDDGVRSKTVNLVLKEDKKKGYFGKLSVAGGTRERTSNEAMLNFFKGKKKVSFYGIQSNTGKTGLGWSDRQRFGGGSDFGDAEVEVGDGYIAITSYDNDFADFGSNYYGEGIPRGIKAGAHFSNKWNRDIHHLNGNYNIKTMDVDAEGGTLTKYILPDSAYYFHENHRSITSQMQQMVTSYYDVKLDSFSSIRFRLNGLTGNSRSDVATESGTDNEDLQQVSRNKRNNFAETDNKVMLASILWRQRLGKTGRTLSLSASHKYSENLSTGFLFSDTYLYDGNGTENHYDSIDQFKEAFNKTLTTQSRLVYTEPLSAATTLELNYSFNRNAFTSDRKSFDKINGKYESLNDQFSNNYSMLFFSHTGGAKVQYNSKKLVANIGTNAGVSNYIQRDSSGSKVNHFRYTNLFPSAQINFRMNSRRTLIFRYNGSPQPPSISQIQPVQENTDPLNIVVGNPDLKQAFLHNLNLSFRNFQVLTGRYMYADAGYSSTHRAIVQNQVTDSIGKRTLQYVNTSGNYTWRMSGSYGFRVKKPEFQIAFSLRASGSRFTSFINSFKNISKNSNVSGSVSMSRYKQDKHAFVLSYQLARNYSRSSISTGQKNAFWSQNLSANMEVSFTKRFLIGTDVNANLREKVDAFDNNNNVVQWNGYIRYKIFPKRNGEFKLEAFDILDQRRGFERYFAQNFMTEKTYQVLRQYFLLTFTWNFTKTPASAPEEK